MPVEPPVCSHGPLQVHEVAWSKIAQICPAQSFVQQIEL
jgi:hypothetical protein